MGRRSMLLGLSTAVLCLLVTTRAAIGVPLTFELANAETPILTSPYALTTRNFTHVEQVGDKYAHTVGFGTYALDFTVLPQQWAIDSILAVLGLSEAEDLLGVNAAETLYHFSATVRLVGDPGESAAISVRPWVSASYDQLYGAIPSGEVNSTIELAYSLSAGGLSGSVYADSGTSGLAGSSSGSLVDDTTLPVFRMVVGDILNVTADFRILSFAEVNPACACIPWTNICQCVAGAGFAFSSTNGNGGIELLAAAIPKPVPEPGTLALLGLGLAGIGLSRRRKAN